MERAKRMGHRQRRGRHKTEPCPMCHQPQKFLWSCTCGFIICDACMQADFWGFSCNGMTWVCPDCGTIRTF